MLKEFSELAFEQQKEKMIAILSELKDDEWFFQKVLKVVKENNNITSEILVWIYKDIFQLIDNMKNLDREWELISIKNISWKIKSLEKQENIEKDNENPDGLLENI